MDQKDNKTQEQFVCKGDCLNCRKQPGERREQWLYCAAQFTYNTMKMLGDVQEQMMAMQDTIDNLSDKIEAIQNGEATVFNPAGEDNPENPTFPNGTSVIPTDHTIAQQGDGVV